MTWEGKKINLVEDEPTESIDLMNLFTSDVTKTGTFDVKGGIWKTAFGKMMQALPIPAFLIDRSSNVIVANRSCEKIGRGYEQALGASFCRLLPENSAADKTRSLLEEVFSKRKPRVTEAALEIDGNRIWGRMTFRSIRISGERLVLCLIEDLTREKEKLQLVEQHRKELRKANELLQREASARRKAAAAQRESENRYRKLFDESRHAVYINKLDGDLIDANQSFLDLFGYTKEDMAKVNIRSLYADPSDRKDFLSEIGKTGSVQNYEVKMRKKEGTLLDCLVSSSVRRGEDGAVVGFQGIISDITQRKRAEDELQRALATSERLAAEAEAANRAKSDFLRNMSHELRTPLNAIIGFSELLLDGICGKLNDEQLEYSMHILDSGRHLLRLINEILDLSKVESGKMTLDLSKVDIRILIETSLIMIKEKAMRHGLLFDLHLADELKVASILADELKLKQIMFNLLSNAVKFTPDGGSIHVEACKQEDRFVVSVSDTGIGLARDDCDRVFGSFERADSPYVRQQQGTGLGLPLTRGLVELHGGRIWVESEGEGKGCLFTFEIPYVEATNESDESDQQGSAQLSVSSSGAREDEGSGATVLVVEDNGLNQKLITELLRRAGYRVLQAETAEEGIEKAKAKAPDLILMDVALPDMDGLTATGILKQDPRTKPIPVVAVTAHAMRDDKEKALAAACVGYIPKPIDTAMFANAVAGFIESAMKT
jgi:PAS domain S-box-containing protein